MTDSAFYWIGLGVVLGLAVIALLAALIFLYAHLLHGRFGLIFFRKGKCRLSLASWYNTRLMSDEHYCADDWPIGPRPFYLSYEIGKRRLFVMAGTLAERRDSPIRGKHPAESLPTPSSDATED